MSTSERLRSQVDEHNAQVSYALARLSMAKNALAEIQKAFAENERQTKAFYRDIIDRVQVIVTNAETDVADLGPAIDTFQPPAFNGASPAPILDITGALRARAAE